MPLFRSAQLHNSDDEVIIFADPMSAAPMHAEHGGMEVEEPSGFHFSFPSIPTGDGEVASIEVSDEPEHSTQGPKDIWDWQAHGLENLMPWVQERMDKMPTHTGETSGIERLINYLKRLNGEISKAISTDFEGKIDVRTLEGARKWIYQSIEKLEDAHENLVDKHYSGKKNKKTSADGERGIRKDAFTPYDGGIIVTVPLLISSLARMLINGAVSQGKQVEATYQAEVEKWELTKREQLELVQHLADMGYPIVRDRGFLPGEQITYGDGTGELARGYYA